MGIIILAIFAVGVYFVGRETVVAVVKRTARKEHVDTKKILPTLTEVSEVPEVSWKRFDEPAFLRHGMKHPVLAEKAVAQPKKRKPRKSKSMQAVLVEEPLFPVTMFEMIEGGCHVA